MYSIDAIIADLILILLFIGIPVFFLIMTIYSIIKHKKCEPEKKKKYKIMSIVFGILTVLNLLGIAGFFWALNRAIMYM